MKLMSLRRGATVITDASYCPDTKLGGYGCWIAMDGTKSQGFSGPLGVECESSYFAELLAAAIGITIAYQTFGATSILIQSDCEGVKNLVRKPTVRREYLGQIEENHSLALRFKHVKGHTRRPEARFWVNRWCDQEANTWMRKERERVAFHNA